MSKEDLPDPVRGYKSLHVRRRERVAEMKKKLAVHPVEENVYSSVTVNG